jgi:hypothetical protein
LVVLLFYAVERSKVKAGSNKLMAVSASATDVAVFSMLCQEDGLAQFGVTIFVTRLCGKGKLAP